MQPLGFGDKNGYTEHAFLYDFCCCAEQWSEFCVGIMICIGALITVAVLKGTKLSAYLRFLCVHWGPRLSFGFRLFY